MNLLDKILDAVKDLDVKAHPAVFIDKVLRVIREDNPKLPQELIYNLAIAGAYNAGLAKAQELVKDLISEREKALSRS